MGLLRKPSSRSGKQSYQKGNEMFLIKKFIELLYIYKIILLHFRNILLKESGLGWWSEIRTSAYCIRQFSTPNCPFSSFPGDVLMPYTGCTKPCVNFIQKKVFSLVNEAFSNFLFSWTLFGLLIWSLILQTVLLFTSL